MRLALAQINTTVGDLDGNAAKVVEWSARAAAEGADLVLFPELTLPGYPAEDLYLRSGFTAACRAALDELAGEIEGIAALAGFAEPAPEAPTHRERPSAYNSLALIKDGRVDAVYRKGALPNYGVFDEQRQFIAEGSPVTRPVNGIQVGLSICEDCWNGGDLAARQAAAGAGLLVNASASPWFRARGRERQRVFAELAGAIELPIAVCNLVGAQDGLVFDGQSFVVDANGQVVARAPQFEEDLLLWETAGGAVDGGIAMRLDELGELRAGLVLGLRDYVDKNGFGGVVLGLSGGIDSALVAALAVEALGPERVTCLVMPSPHSSEQTQADARRMAERLGARLAVLPIGATMAAYESVLEEGGLGIDGVSAENVQARIRGNLVMAVSNRDGLLALACGNKSEAAVGYATLYGDMAGGLAPIKDLSKTLVYELSGELNRTGLRPPAGSAAGARTIEAPIPESIVERPPSAELRPGQRDSDSLPPYELLDPALEAHIERHLGPAEMVAEGIDPAVADRVVELVLGSEHKRRQAAPGIRVTAKAFDRDWRMPITNRYRP